MPINVELFFIYFKFNLQFEIFKLGKIEVLNLTREVWAIKDMKELLEVMTIS